MELEGRPDVVDVLSTEIRVRFPGVPFGRPSRFYDTVKRIVGPTKPSVRGPLDHPWHLTGGECGNLVSELQV